ncbi:zinc finger, CCHC-type containing protein [Tanacetum coccineum]
MDAHSTDFGRNWLERLPAGSITTWEDLTTRFLAQFFPPRRTTKLRNDILMFQQHHGESPSEAWTRFKDLLQKSLIMASTCGLKSKFFMTIPIPSQDEPLTNRPVSQEKKKKKIDVELCGVCISSSESWLSNQTSVYSYK